MKAHTLEQQISGITTDIDDNTLRITAGDYKLVAKKEFGKWYFIERLSTVPFLPCHFSLRKQLHYALNPVNG